MDKARHKRNYDLHSWSGVTLGIFLFIVCFTGSVAVFALDETRVWEDPAQRIEFSGEAAPITETFNEWFTAQNQRGEVDSLRLFWPTATRPFYTANANIHLNESEEHERLSQRWHPITLEPTKTREASMSSWLVNFHIYLKWPTELGGASVGRFVVGLAGILLLLSIVTGVVAHTKLREEAFSLRLNKSVRLKWQDSHKVVGLWGAPFHIMIGFTGAILGIVTTLTPVVAILMFQGNVAALIEVAEGEPVIASGKSAEMLSLETVRSIVQPETGVEPNRVDFTHYGDESAVYTGFWPATEQIASRHAFKIDGVTGEALPLEAFEETDSAVKRVYAALGPLHFGTFGGVALKFVWFSLGLSLSVITAFGTMMWIERRQYGNAGHRSDQFYKRLSKLNVGICTGLAVATAGLFVHNVLYWGAETGRGMAIAWTYLSVWALAIVYAFIRDGIYKANRELIALTGALLILAAILNQLLTELPAGGIGNHTRTLMIDITLIVFGVSALLIAKALPQKRPEKKRIGKNSELAIEDNSVPAPAE